MLVIEVSILFTALTNSSTVCAIAFIYSDKGREEKDNVDVVGELGSLLVPNDPNLVLSKSLYERVFISPVSLSITPFVPFVKFSTIGNIF
jgi:hypothetical protein